VDLTPPQIKLQAPQSETLLITGICVNFENVKPPYRKHYSDSSECAPYSSFVLKKPNLTQMKQEFKYLRAQWHSQLKILGGSKFLIFRRATAFCLRYCLLKFKMTRYS